MNEELVDFNTLVSKVGRTRQISGDALVRAIASAPTVTAFLAPPAFDDSTDLRPIAHVIDPSVRTELGIQPGGAAGSSEEAERALRYARSLLEAQHVPPPTRTPGAPAPYTIRLHAVLCSDDNGTGAANPKDMPALMEKVMPQINVVYKKAAVRFVFNRDSDFEFRKSTLLNRDFTVPPGTVYGSDPNVPPMNEAQVKAAAKAHHAARTALAAQRRGKLVLFLSDGSGFWYDTSLKRWYLVSRGGGYSSHEMDYLVTSMSLNAPQGSAAILNTANHLAHEIGHNLHLPHTFGNYVAQHPDIDSSTISIDEKLEYVRESIRNEIKAYVAAGQPRSKGLMAFDGDHRDFQFISDTPADPGPHLLTLENRKAGRVTNPETCGSVKSATVEVKFGDNDNEPYTFTPDQDNVMSYYAQCDSQVAPHLSNDQMRRIRHVLEDRNRQHLVFPARTKWSLDSNGWKLTLHVLSMDNIVGGFTGFIQNGTRQDWVQGLWDANSWRICFTRVSSPSDLSAPDILTIQIYTGYLLRKKRQPLFAGSFEAFSGSGATAERSVYGWTAEMIGEPATDVSPPSWSF